MSQLWNSYFFKFRNNTLAFELCLPELGPTQDNRTQISVTLQDWSQQFGFLSVQSRVAASEVNLTFVKVEST
jgi:hypothetical protein